MYVCIKYFRIFVKIDSFVKSYIGYVFFKLTALSFKLMPFPILYIYSDILYFLLYKVIGYRKKVVFNNLRSAFPEKSEKEIEFQAKKFYKHLSDITLEGIKAFTMSKKQMLARFKIVEDEIVQNYYAEGKSIIALAAHYSNWEWGGIGAQVIPHELFTLYKPLKNIYIDKYARASRSVWGANMISIKKTYEFFKEEHPRPRIVFMLADQSSHKRQQAYWIDFLNHKTDFLHGPEKYAQLFNFPVVYAYVTRVKRGFYEVRFLNVTDNPKDLPETELTKEFARILETYIKQDPSQWLWSHKRWKHSPPTEAQSVS